jgi:serine/threonine protein kinase
MTTPESPVEAIFSAALAKCSPEERAAYLDAACGGDPEQRRRVERLLEAHPKLGSFLQGDAPDPVATIDGPPAHESPGTAIGPYKLMEQIGEGGMGTVYMAEQTHPVRRLVALKVIKAGMDTCQVLARFDAERQALALMDHPNIAKVLDAGATAAGRPYFVMDLVKGVPITRYCDERRLTPRERLELFIPVCQAVQHAHQKGIIHRDLKPSNVLVGLYDGQPVPKVIDFGVAKATGQKLTEATLFTGFGAVVGTPEYMSPEQAQLDNLDIDTRSDVYALGVLLYELLTGTTPLDCCRLKEAALLEVLRVIREEDPQRPSTRLSTTEDLPSIAACRNVEPRKLSGLLRGELDWIVMKALEKDRNRRYETANALARDVQRYLADEVVEARPPSTGYRLRKFARRNKGRVLAAALVLLALVAGTVGTTWGYLRAERARKAEARRAESERLAKLDAQQQKAAAEAAEKAARGEAEKVKVINEFLTHDLLSQAEPANNAVEDKVTLLEVLDRAAANVGERLAGQPELEQALRVTIAATYHGLAAWEKAEAQRRVLLDSARRQGAESVETYRAMSNLAHILGHRGQIGVETQTMAETAEKGLERLLGPDHPETLAAMSILASAYLHAQKLDLALPLLEKTLRLRKAKLGPEHPETLLSMHKLAVGYQVAGKLDRALPLHEETMRLSKAKLGSNHPDTLNAAGGLAACYRVAGKLDQALPLLEGALRLMKAKLGPDHPDTLNAMIHLAVAYRDAGKRERALPLFEETLRLSRAKLGPDHPDTLASMNQLASCYWSQGQLDKSIPLFEELLKRESAALGRQHPDTLRDVANLGVNYKDVGRLAEALPLLEEGYFARKKYPGLRVFGTQLLDAYTRANKTAEATTLVQQLVDDARRTLPPESPDLAGMLAQLGMALLDVRSFADAEPLLRECLSIRERKQPDSWMTFNTRSRLGGALLGQGQFAAAEPLLLAGYEGMKKREETIPLARRHCLAEAGDRLVDLYKATNRTDELKRWQAERALYKKARNSPPPGKN